MSKPPKVSVCIVTYNQEKYIGKCLESIVTQKCNFDFEVIVGDDCSTDKTQKIIQEYLDKYPNIVKAIFQKQNTGGGDNYFSVHSMAKGEYIAHMDGDDYALPGKLQVQADFIDKTPDCNICFHRVKILHKDGSIRNDFIRYEEIKEGFKRNDLLKYMAVATHSSKMYRKSVQNFKKPTFTILDFFLNVEQIQNKKAYFVNSNIYGVYRQGVGIGTSQNASIRYAIIETLDYFAKKYPYYRMEINMLVLLHLLLDIKNKRPTMIANLGLFVRTFHIGSLILLLREWKKLGMFKLK